MATLTETAIARRIFDFCDLDGDGFFDPNEFHLLLQALDDDVSAAESLLNFQALDTEGDGYIGFKEFVLWWTN